MNTNNVLRNQVILGLVVMAIVIACSPNERNILSVLTGTLMVIVPSLIYQIIAFRHGIVRLPQQALKSHRSAFVGKFLTNMVLFGTLAYFSRYVSVIYVLITYVAVSFGYWLSLIKN